MKFPKKRILLILFALYIPISNCFPVATFPEREGIFFLMVYKTDRPLELSKSVLYYSESKWLSKKQDSLVIDLKSLQGLPDSITYNSRWESAGYMKLKLYGQGLVLESNTLYYSKNNSFYDVFVGDTSLVIRPKLSGDDFAEQSSLRGLALVIQTIVDMLIVLMICRLFGTSHLIILMVLVANIAAFPVYTLNMGVFSREILVFLIKAVVMSLIGMKKVPVLKSLSILSLLTIIGLGMKELFFFIVRVM